MGYYQFKGEYAIEQPIDGKTCEVWQYDRATRRSHKIMKTVTAVVGYKNEEQLRATLDPHRSRLLKKDCLNLPPKLYRSRTFEMTAKMRRAYEDMVNEFLIELDNGQAVTARMAMVQLIRLQQITCGFLVPDGSDVMAENPPGIAIEEKNPRIEALLQEVEKINGMAIIWSYKRYSLREIARVLRESYGADSVVEYHGGINDTDKADSIRAFHERRCRFFVGNPQSAGMGIDLTEAQDVIYYDNSFSLALRLQSEDRFHRIGQKGECCTITDVLCSNSIDIKQLNALKKKHNVASAISGDNIRDWLINGDKNGESIYC